MANRVPWQDIYVIQQTTVNIKQQGRYLVAGDIGIGGDGSLLGKFRLPLTNHPNLPTPSISNNLALATGLSQDRTIEYSETGAEVATVTLEMPANAYNLSLFLWLLFQTGASEADSTVNTATYVRYTSMDCEVWAAITRVLAATTTSICADTLSHMLVGCICRSITISGEAGGHINLSAEMLIGRHNILNVYTKATNAPRLNCFITTAALDDNFNSVSHAGVNYTTIDSLSSGAFSLADASTCVQYAAGNFTDSSTSEVISSGDFHFPQGDVTSAEKIIVNPKATNHLWSTLAQDTFAFLKFESAIFMLGDAVASLAQINIPSFSYTITNNATAQYYDTPNVVKYVLGKLESSGSFFIPWGASSEGANTVLTDYKAGNDMSFRIYWGNAGATIDNSFSITDNIVYNEPPTIEGDSELGYNTTFKGAFDGTNSISIKCGYTNANLDRGIS